ncbi:hypothetical protein Rhe02_19290 [Rhizocola hellebori]|uniref:Uncharacterized protein n=1 Tax=Rhizocola hellebori TaxID=1392758 RepID=A0A8J3Q5W3_9ACTN|nr:hypothetical protein [Rhizocola hellebori]GIH03862.1 hypothetical protein Rhe02_19290 [Rhizocola hellebori]
MGFLGLTPLAVDVLALRIAQAADALEEAAADAAAASALAELDDENLPTESRTMASDLRGAATTLTGRAGYLSGYVLPAIEVAQALTPGPALVQQQPHRPVPGEHFMDQIVWFVASDWESNRGVRGTEFKGSAGLDVFGFAAEAGWQIDVRVQPGGGPVEVRMANSATLSLSNGSPSLDSLVKAQARWQYPITWALPGLGRLLPNTGTYAQTFWFPSEDAAKAFFQRYVDEVAVYGVDLANNANVGLAMGTFAQLYTNIYGTGPIGYTVDFGQQLSFVAGLGLRAPVDRLLGGGSLDPATGKFLNDLALAFDGEASAQLTYGFSIDRYTTAGYQVPGMEFAQPPGWATTAWLRAQGDAQVRLSGRVLLFGEAIGAQIEADVRAGVVFDRWGEARQVVLRATVAGYQFPDSGTLCIPLGDGTWLKVTQDSWSLIPGNEATLMIGDDDALVRVIEFERTINLDSPRAMAQAQMQHQIDASGLDRLNIAVAQDPSLGDDVDRALQELKTLTGVDVPAEQWQAILEQTMRPADPWNPPSAQITGLVAGTPLAEVPEGVLRTWAEVYLHPIAQQTGNSRWFFGWSDGLTPWDISWAAEHRIADMNDEQVQDYLTTTSGIEPEGWEITTYEGTQRLQAAELSGDVDPALLAQAAAGYFNGSVEAQRLDYHQIGQWQFTDAKYQELIALFPDQLPQAVQRLEDENQIQTTPTPTP